MIKARYFGSLEFNCLLLILIVSLLGVRFSEQETTVGILYYGCVLRERNRAWFPMCVMNQDIDKRDAFCYLGYTGDIKMLLLEPLLKASESPTTQFVVKVDSVCVCVFLCVFENNSKSTLKVLQPSTMPLLETLFPYP